MENNPQPASASSGISGKAIFLSISWIASLVFASAVGFNIGQGSHPEGITKEKNVLMAKTQQEVVSTPTPIESGQSSINSGQTSQVQVSPTAVPNTVCKKFGFAQKFEYLTPYIIKENDTLQTIATTELKDVTRVNELLQLNGVNPLIVGSTLYLPPPTITKSSGNIRQVYGLLKEKNSTSWHIGLSSDAKGQGLLIPSFLFEEVPNKNSYVAGDCVTILFEDGFKVYSVTRQ